MKYLATSALVVLCSSLVLGQIPGGISDPVPIEPLHIQLARFAVGQMGNHYRLIRVLRVRTQVVEGILYHIDISVIKFWQGRRIPQICLVKVQHRPWLPGQEMTLVDFRCRNAGPFGSHGY